MGNLNCMSYNGNGKFEEGSMMIKVKNKRIISKENEIEKNKITFNFLNVFNYLNDIGIRNLTSDNMSIKIKENNSKFTESVSFGQKGTHQCMIYVLNFDDIKTEKYFNNLIQTENVNFSFLSKCIGFITQNENILLVYHLLKTSLYDLIKSNSLDLDNKIIISKTLIKCLKVSHENGLTFLDLNPNTVRFYGSKFILKICGVGKSEDDLIKKKDTRNLGYILLSLFSNDVEINTKALNFDKIDNIYIKAFIIGLCRENPDEIPNSDDIVKVYNILIQSIFENENEKIVLYQI